MSQQRLLWLPDTLRDGGCKVTNVAGWRNRSRPESSGGFAPFGVLVHHTGTRTSKSNPAPTLATCVHGRPDLPGPLCQLLLGFDGVFRTVAAGRANHAGTAQPSGPMPAGDGNALYIGIEVDYSGSQDMSDVQMAALVKGCAAILEHLGKDESFLRGHKETSSAGKWDPGRHGSDSPEYRMGAIREAVKARMQPRVQYVLFDGDTGQELSHSAAVLAGDTKARRERLAAFLENRTAMMDKELQSDNDVVVRRRKV